MTRLKNNSSQNEQLAKWPTDKNDTFLKWLVENIDVWQND